MTSCYQGSKKSAEQQKTPARWTPKHDLLYMYICLGHLPDRNLSLEEISKIIERFQGWLPDITPAGFKKLRKEVLEHYRKLSDFKERFDQFVKSAYMLRDFFHDNEMKLVNLMDDLISIARADRIITTEEIELIKAAVKAWWLDLDPCTDDRTENLKNKIRADHIQLEESKKPGDWRKHHDLLYMYVCMGHLPDREFSYEEVEAIMRLWKRRFPQMLPPEFQRIRTTVMNRYNEYETTQERYNQFLISAEMLKRVYRDKHKKLAGILEDLYAIARADGIVHENEITMIEAAAKVWGIDVSIDMNRERWNAELRIQSEADRRAALPPE